jgi:hypothetical protein
MRLTGGAVTLRLLLPSSYSSYEGVRPSRQCPSDDYMMMRHHYRENKTRYLLAANGTRPELGPSIAASGPPRLVFQ